MVRRQTPPFAVDLGSRGPLRVGTVRWMSIIDFGCSGSLSFFPHFAVIYPSFRPAAALIVSGNGYGLAVEAVVVVLAVLFGALAAAPGRLVAYGLACFFEPVPGPGEFEAEDRETAGDHEKCGSGGYDHDDTEQQHREADDGDNDAPGDFVGYADQAVHWIQLVL